MMHEERALTPEITTADGGIASPLLGALHEAQETGANESTFRGIVEQSAIAMVIFAPDGRVVLANQAFGELWGAGPARFPVHYRITDDRQLEELGLLAPVRRAFDGDRVRLPPMRYSPSRSGLPGRTVTVETQFFPFRERDVVRGVVGVYQDVTSRVDAERDRDFLYALAETLQSLSSSEGIAEAATERVARYLGVARCSWAQVDAAGGTFTVRHEWRRGGDALAGTHALQRWDGGPDAMLRRGDGDAEGAIVAIDDTATDPRSSAVHARILAPLGVRAFLRVPIVAHGQWVGNLGVADDRARTWTAREIALLRGAAARLWPPFAAAEQAALAESERLAAIAARRRIEALQELTALLSGATTQQAVCDIVAQRGSAAVGAQSGVVMLLAGDGGGASLRASSWVGHSEASRTALAHLPLDARTPLTECVRSRDAIWLDSAEEMARRYDGFARLSPATGSGAWGCLPLRRADVGGAPAIGALGIGFDGPRIVSDDDRRIAATIAALAEGALSRVRLFESERTARIRTERLQRITAALSRSLTASEIAEIVLAEGMTALGASNALVALATADRSGLEIRASRGIPEGVLAPFRRFAFDAAIPLAEAARTERLLVIASLADFEARFPSLAPAQRELGVETGVVIPLVAGGRAVGAVSFNFSARRTFSREEQGIMVALASQCAQAIDRAMLYEAEHKARTAAESASQAKTQFLAAMSHELRTPLNAIQGHVQLIELGVHGEINDAQRTALERVQRNQRHLLKLVNDLLNLSRIESGHVEFHVEELQLFEVVHEVSEMIEPQLRAKDLIYTSTVDPRVRVRADREKLVQILLNLLDNAIKFTPERGRVTVDTAQRAPLSRIVFLRVSDTGRGIGIDKLRTIFEPFVQLEKFTVRKELGVGLGLAISHDLARGMGGDLRARSTAGKGSTFTLTLPVST